VQWVRDLLPRAVRVGVALPIVAARRAPDHPSLAGRRTIAADVATSYPRPIDTTGRLCFAWYGCRDREIAARPRNEPDRPQTPRHQHDLAQTYRSCDRIRGDRALGARRSQVLGVGSGLAALAAH